jgi:putative iron-dependent peroxidase
MQPDPQPAINTTQNRAAIFLVLAIRPGAAHADGARLVCGDLAALQRAVGARDSEGNLSCVLAFGSEAWDRLFGVPRPRELHTLRELRSGPRVAPSTPGDLLFHIRAERMDLCFELAAQLMARLVDNVTPVDEVHGFRYFDDRDLTGFVDGTENPTGLESLEATIVGAEDPAFAGGSYVVVQKYVHDHLRWIKLPSEMQEGIIGRTKLDDIELDDTVKPTYAHNTLTKLVENGVEVKIRRHNMPFGNVSDEQAGTYFIGYARSPDPIEKMLERMVVGDPPGNYDRLLDFTRPVTGTLFFAPSTRFLADLGQPPPPTPPQLRQPQQSQQPGPVSPAPPAGGLGIGSLKGVPQHE